MIIKEVAPQITLGLTRYNPETGSFVARAELHENTICYTYRVSVKAPPHAEFETIVRGLKAQTLRRHQDAKEKTQKLIRRAVRSVLARSRASAVRDKQSFGIGAFLSA